MLQFKRILLMPWRTGALLHSVAACSPMLALLLCGAWGNEASSAAVPTTATFTVSAQVVPGCVISGQQTQTSGINFGVVNFGMQPATYSGALSALAVGDAGPLPTLQCTPGTSLQVSVNAGLNAQGSQRRLSNAAGGFIPYALTLLASPDTLLSPHVPASISIGAIAVALPIRGDLTLPGTGLAPGIYADTVQVTLTW